MKNLMNKICLIILYIINLGLIIGGLYLLPITDNSPLAYLFIVAGILGLFSSINLSLRK